MASRIAGKLIHGPIQWLKAQAETSTEPEPDYGMSKLTPAELTGLFYRPLTTEDELTTDDRRTCKT